MGRAWVSVVQETKLQLRKQESERRRHLAQAGAKGAEPTAVRLWKMGSEQVLCKRRAAERPG